jgi:paraquat-inducible protein B
MSRRANPATIGAFVLGAIAIAAFGVISLGSGRLFSEMDRSSMFFQGSVNGLVIGSPVKIQGVPIGQVVEIRAIVDQTKPGNAETLTETVVEIDPRRFDQTSAREFDDAENEGNSAVRAQLNLQSILTGQLYIALTIDPDREGFMGPKRLARYRQIPTIPTTFEEIEARFRGVLDRVRQMPLEEMLKNLDRTIVAIGDVARDPEIKTAIEEVVVTLRETRALVKRVDGQIDPLMEGMMEALDELKSTLASAGQTFDPGSPVAYQLGATLQEVSLAAQAMRALANSLERQPNAIVFGPAGDPQ